MGREGQEMPVDENLESDKSKKESSSSHGQDDPTPKNQGQKEQQRESDPSSSVSTSWCTFLLTFLFLPHVTCSLFVTLYVILLLVSPTWLRAMWVLYLLYVALDTTPSKGGYSWAPPVDSKTVEYGMRRLFWYKAMANYFPVHLVKTVDLPATNGDDKKKQKNAYLFAYHPHGVIGVGACSTLLTNATDFDLKFPGLPRRFATLNVIFLIPIFREYLLLMGFVSADKSSLRRVLHRRESVVLLPGGAAEALMANPKSFQLHLQQRKGFIKLAVETKTAIVPVLGFGENQTFKIYNPPKGSFLAKLQAMLCKWFSFSTPFITSPFPQRKRVHVVVGKPVHFDDSPLSIEECHAHYLKAVEELYNQHKGKYGHEHIPLEIC